MSDLPEVDLISDGAQLAATRVKNCNQVIRRRAGGDNFSARQHGDSRGRLERDIQK